MFLQIMLGIFIFIFGFYFGFHCGQRGAVIESIKVLDKLQKQMKERKM